jgi:hypothetical protein
MLPIFVSSQQKKKFPLSTMSLWGRGLERYAVSRGYATIKRIGNSSTFVTTS